MKEDKLHFVLSLLSSTEAFPKSSLGISKAARHALAKVL